MCPSLVEIRSVTSEIGRRKEEEEEEEEKKKKKKRPQR